jgi:4-amino-4-deoxy-L-arabinose transferase-like glycosyltransferase
VRSQPGESWGSCARLGLFHPGCTGDSSRSSAVQDRVSLASCELVPICGILPAMDNRSTSSRPATSYASWKVIGILLLTLLAFGLRLYRMDFQPLWGDEGWSFYFASMSLGEMVRLTAQDIHPPLYYALLSGWLRLVGSTPETARFLSILFGTLLVPVSYRVATRLFDRIVAVATAGLVALAPLAIYYSQEVRMYGLVTLLGLASAYFFSQQLADGRRLINFEDYPGQKKGAQAWHMWGYALTTAAALYTMYYAVFIPLFQLIVFLALNRRRSPRTWATHPFIRSLVIAALFYLPWVMYAGAQLITYVQGKRIAEGYAPLGLLQFIGAHLIAFSLGHLSDASRVLAWSGLLFIPVSLLGLAYHASRATRAASQATRHTSANMQYAPGNKYPSYLVACYLLVPLLLGYVVNLLYPFTPRYFERTLLLAAPAWWLLLGAGLAWLWRRSRLMLAGVVAAILVIESVALLDFYKVPRYPDQDYRALMSYVDAHSSSEDAFLASYQWQVGFYYAYLSLPRPILYQVPGWGETWAAQPDRMHADLDALINHHPQLWFPAYQALGRLWENQAQAYLNRSAFPVQVDWSLPDTKLLLYARGNGLSPAAASFNFADRLLVDRAEVGPSPVAAGQDVLPVALLWHKLDLGDTNLGIALRLVDASGRIWATRDSLPQGGDASFSDLAVGQLLVDHHGLAIPAGTPPGDYQLRLSVYDLADQQPLDLVDDQHQPQGVEATLSTVQVVLPDRPVPAAALPVQHRGTFEFDKSVRLIGYSLGDGPFRAGDSLPFSLFWQSLTDHNQPYVVFAQLQDQSNTPLALSESPPIYPSEHWSTGTLLRDPREIPLPATLPAGTYRLVVGLLRPDGTRLSVQGKDQIVLTDVETTQRSHVFSPPSSGQPMDARFGDSARLAGYDLSEGTHVQAGQSLQLVLHWQALKTFSQRYTVFVHLVDANDRILGQRDQVPGNGQFPTTSWIPGEYLSDTYVILLDPDTPPGQYWIEIGLYNPLDGTRLPVSAADGQPLGDRLLLNQTPIRVEPS